MVDVAARAGVSHQTVSHVLATRHLLTLGHRTIAHLAGPPDWPQAMARQAGFDDIPEAAFCQPPLTTLRQDFAALGRGARGHAAPSTSWAARGAWAKRGVPSPPAEHEGASRPRCVTLGTVDRRPTVSPGSGRSEHGHHTAADRLEQARSTSSGLPLFSREPGGLSEEEAWAIAAEVDRRLVERGRHRTGYKLGWTSDAMREALGIDAPNFGSLWDDMVADSTLALSRLRHPKAEPEFAFLADRALSGSEVGAADVQRAGRWAVALEVVDPRWESYEFTWLDNTADGSSAAAYAVGAFVAAEVAPEDLALTMAWRRRAAVGRRPGCNGVTRRRPWPTSCASWPSAARASRPG